MAVGAVADMLPRQRRTGVATDGARRERMRPWQRPQGGRRFDRPPNGPRASRVPSTEFRIPGVAFPAPAPRERPGSGHPPRAARTAAGMSAHPSAQPHPTIDIRPFFETEGTGGEAANCLTHPRSSMFGRRCAGRRPRSPARPANACGTPPRDPELTVREAGFASRTGPPPAGNGAAISPSPCVQHSGPIHAAPMQAPARWPGQSARTGARPHTGVHARAPRNRPRESRRGHREHGPPVRPRRPSALVGGRFRAGLHAWGGRRGPPRTPSAAAGAGPAPRPGSLHAPSAPPPHFPRPPSSLPPSCVRPCRPVDRYRSHPPHDSPRAAGTDNNPAIRTSGP